MAGLGATINVLINTSTQVTSTALIPSLNPSSFGQGVTFTATVTAQPGFYDGPPTGPVSFFDGATSIGKSQLSSSGVATLTTASLILITEELLQSLPACKEPIPTCRPDNH